MDISGKEVAVIVQALKVAHFDELAEKVIKHFNELNERFAEVWWTKEDIKEAFERYGRTPTEESVQNVFDNLDDEGIKEAMIEDGWDIVYEAVKEYIKNNETEEM